jgi:WD40 repeat protein
MPNIVLRDWSNFITESNADQVVDSSTQMNASQEHRQSVAIPHVAFSPLGKLFVCGYDEPVDGEASALQMWELETGSPVGERMLGPVLGITAVAFSPDGNRVVAGSKDGTVLLWNTSTRSQIGNPMKGHRNDICCVVFSPDGRHLASSSSDQIQIWDAESTEAIWSITRDTNNAVIAFSPEGTEIAGVGHSKVGTSDMEAICVWDYKTDEAKTREIADSHTDALAFSPTETFLASSHRDCIRIWEVDDTIIPVAEIALQPDLQLGRMNGPYPLGISSDGTLLAYGHSVWNITSLPPKQLDPTKRPSSLLEPEGYGHSLLTYVDGWIYAAWPQGRLIPVPQYLRAHFDGWSAWRNQIVVWTESRQPVVIDCSPLLP